VEPDVNFALELADMADSISMARFRARDLIVDKKADYSPVTDADREVEQRLRDRITQAFPDHAVVGEEYGADSRGGATWQWLIDPIDGTRSYVRGNETWATLIAVQREGQTVVAVASAPAMRLRFHAARGGGACLSGKPIHVSRIASLDQAMITHTSIPGFVRVGLADRLVALAGRCWDARGLGNSMSHLAVARGTADIGWTSRANVWDFAALALIVEEAGGRFTDRSRDDPKLGGTGISTNGLLHQVVLKAAGL